MPDQLLDRILAEIRDRLDASREAYEESQRLDAALRALGSGGPAEPSRPRATSRRASRSRPSARAPRGENLRRIRALVAERPGATAGEIASATGVARPTVASTLGKLARGGEPARQGRSQWGAREAQAAIRPRRLPPRRQRPGRRHPGYRGRDDIRAH